MMCSTIAFQKICFLSLRLRDQSLEYQISLTATTRLTRWQQIAPISVFIPANYCLWKAKLDHHLNPPRAPCGVFFVFSTGALNVAALSSQPEPWDTIREAAKKKKRFFLGDLSQICLPTHPPQGFCEIWEHKRWIFVRPEIVIFIWETVPPPTHVWEKFPQKKTFFIGKIFFCAFPKI